MSKMPFKFFIAIFILLLLIYFISIKKPKVNNIPNIEISKKFHFIDLPNIMPNPRECHKSILLNDGRVLIFGNNNEFLHETSDTLQKVDLYNPKTKKFSTIGKSNFFTHFKPSALILNNGNVLLSSKTKEAINMESFNPSTLEFKQIKIAHPISEKFLLLKNGNLLSSNGDKIEVYDYKSWKTLKSAKLIKKRQQFQSILLSDGEVLFLGGIDQTGKAIQEVESYDQSKNTSSIVGKIQVARKEPICLLLQNGNVFIAGGQKIKSNKQNQTVYEVEIYNPTTNKSFIAGKTLAFNQNINDLTEDDLNYQALLLKDGKVLIYSGGKYFSIDENVCGQVYDPVKNKFTLIANNIIDRKNYQMTLLQDGNVLITGGTPVDPLLEFSDKVIPCSNVEILVTNWPLLGN